ncbi:MAG: hypothetical protein AAF664_18445 [Planctomycetota bacterium]
MPRQIIRQSAFLACVFCVTYFSLACEFESELHLLGGFVVAATTAWWLWEPSQKKKFFRQPHLYTCVFGVSAALVLRQNSGNDDLAAIWFLQSICTNFLVTALAAFILRLFFRKRLQLGRSGEQGNLGGNRSFAILDLLLMTTVIALTVSLYRNQEQFTLVTLRQRLSTECIWIVLQIVFSIFLLHWLVKASRRTILALFTPVTITFAASAFLVASLVGESSLAEFEDSWLQWPPLQSAFSLTMRLLGGNVFFLLLSLQRVSWNSLRTHRTNYRVLSWLGKRGSQAFIWLLILIALLLNTAMPHGHFDSLPLDDEESLPKMAGWPFSQATSLDSSSWIDSSSMTSTPGLLNCVIAVFLATIVFLVLRKSWNSVSVWCVRLLGGNAKGRIGIAELSRAAFTICLPPAIGFCAAVFLGKVVFDANSIVTRFEANERRMIDRLLLRNEPIGVPLPAIESILCRISGRSNSELNGEASHLPTTIHTLEMNGLEAAAQLNERESELVTNYIELTHQQGRLTNLSLLSPEFEADEDPINAWISSPILTDFAYGSPLKNEQLKELTGNPNLRSLSVVCPEGFESEFSSPRLTNLSISNVRDASKIAFPEDLEILHLDLVANHQEIQISELSRLESVSIAGDSKIQRVALSNLPSLHMVTVSSEFELLNVENCSLAGVALGPSDGAELYFAGNFKEGIDVLTIPRDFSSIPLEELFPGSIKTNLSELYASQRVLEGRDFQFISQSPNLVGLALPQCQVRPSFTKRLLESQSSLALERLGFAGTPFDNESISIWLKRCPKAVMVEFSCKDPIQIDLSQNRDLFNAIFINVSELISFKDRLPWRVEKVQFTDHVPVKRCEYLSFEDYVFDRNQLEELIDEQGSGICFTGTEFLDEFWRDFDFSDIRILSFHHALPDAGLVDSWDRRSFAKLWRIELHGGEESIPTELIRSLRDVLPARCQFDARTLPFCADNFYARVQLDGRKVTDELIELCSSLEDVKEISLRGCSIDNEHASSILNTVAPTTICLLPSDEIPPAFLEAESSGDLRIALVSVGPPELEGISEYVKSRISRIMVWKQFLAGLR